MKMPTFQESNRGFTLIELIMVIVVLGFLAVIAIPEYVDLAPKAKKASEEGVVGGVRAGIATQIAKRAIGTFGTDVYPPALDTLVVGTGVNCGAITGPAFCFDLVIPGGIRDSGWSKTAAATYAGPNLGTSDTYVYTSTNGAFA